MTFLRLCLATACALLAVAAHAGGTAVLIGGALRDDNAAVWAGLVALAGGPGARFAVLATASGEPVQSAAAIVANLQRHGALAQAVPVAPLISGIDIAAAVRNPAFIAQVRESQAVFFSGGAQARLIDTLAPAGQSTPLLDAVRAVFDGGGVVAGTSSGAAVMSRTAFIDVPDVRAAMLDPLRDGAETGRGFGFVPASVVVDQHFGQRGRIGRLLPLLAARGIALGLGVDEDTAAIVQGDTVDVLGRHGVWVVDMAGATQGAAAGTLNVRGVRLSVLRSGDRFTLADRRYTSGRADAQRMPPASGSGGGAAAVHVDPPADMLAPGALNAAVAGLVQGPQPQALGWSNGPSAQAPAFLWRLHKAADTQAWCTPASPGKASDDCSVANLRLDVRPAPVQQPRASPNTP